MIYLIWNNFTDILTYIAQRYIWPVFFVLLLFWWFIFLERIWPWFSVKCRFIRYNMGVHYLLTSSGLAFDVHSQRNIHHFSSQNNPNLDERILKLLLLLSKQSPNWNVKKLSNTNKTDKVSTYKFGKCNVNIYKRFKFEIFRDYWE